MKSLMLARDIAHNVMQNARLMVDISCHELISYRTLHQNQGSLADVFAEQGVDERACMWCAWRTRITAARKTIESIKHAINWIMC